MIASKQLKKSVKNIPLLANAFSKISIKKKVKNAESIYANTCGSVFNISKKVRSSRMNTA